MRRVAAGVHPGGAPFWLPWLAGVPMVACMTGDCRVEISLPFRALAAGA